MAHARHLISAITLCAAALCSPTQTLAHESLNNDNRQAGAAVNFSIIVPAVLRILENSHPLSLPVTDTPSPRVSVLQRLVLVSTLGKGFCMDLQLTQQQLTDWQLKVSGSTGARIEPSEGGYRLCIGRAGRYEVVLQHDFHLKDGPRASLAPALGWPVHISLAAP
jgi:hypothetical protein